ncbi:sperm microtubule associated protein 2-like [Halyomorpha halys]|uniref:sperm microtubule associated protein 2-like n=1 Tax=Halyomorpha halys TaxID=286706 RepID=UPI0006D51AF9|nr:testicular haploid expressed gene protein-like [Halyomorpha halys]
MPIIKARDYDGSPAFNQAWTLMTRAMHTEMLSKPLPRRLAPWPDPNFYQPLPVEITHATLNYATSKRLKILSRVPRGKYTPKFKIQLPSEHHVEPGNLTFVPGPRLLELAQPRTISLPYKERRSTRKAKRKHKNWEKERDDWLALRAAPKPIPPQPPIPKWKRKTAPLSPEEREVRIVQLSKPTPRYMFRPDPWDPYQVNPKSQRARATKRTLELAAHRELPEEARLDLAYKPFTITKSALKYKPSKRVLDLAEPIVKRTAANNDIREDAFQVPKRALKAMCTKRTKELAKPIVRRGW